MDGSTHAPPLESHQNRPLPHHHHLTTPDVPQSSPSHLTSTAIHTFKPSGCKWCMPLPGYQWETASVPAALPPSASCVHACVLSVEQAFSTAHPSVKVQRKWQIYSTSAHSGASMATANAIHRHGEVLSASYSWVLLNLSTRLQTSRPAPLLPPSLLRRSGGDRRCSSGGGISW